MKRKTSLLFVFVIYLFAGNANAQLYKDPKAPVEKRVADLLKRMTLEEKVGQMSMSSLRESLKDSIAYGVLESPFVSAREVAEQSAIAKKHARQSRLGIPPIQIGE